MSKKDLEYIKSQSVISILKGDKPQVYDCKALEILFSHLKNNGFENTKNSLHSEILKLQNYEKEEHERRNNLTSENLGNNLPKKNKTIKEDLVDENNTKKSNTCPKIFLDYPSLLSFLIDS